MLFNQEKCIAVYTAKRSLRKRLTFIEGVSASERSLRLRPQESFQDKELSDFSPIYQCAFFFFFFFLQDK